MKSANSYDEYVRKVYGGARLRRLREERRLTQAVLARNLDLSVSYVNQLENDQRPLTVQVLLKLAATYGLDPQYFSADRDARLIADLHDALASAGGDPVPASAVTDLANRSPEIAQTIVTLHRRLAGATQQLERFGAHISSDFVYEPMPFEEVRDFFYDRRNHIAELDVAAEDVFRSSALSIGSLDVQLTELLAADHNVTVRLRTDPPDRRSPKREFDQHDRVLTLSRLLSPGQRAFQLATQLAYLSQGALIDRLIAEETGFSADARALARIGLANYFAGAMLLPYNTFLDAAEAVHYDIELLALQFEVSYETICHRLSTLQRVGRQGVPFFFVRVDQAGNISKRQSATAFHFSRVGGSCPLWVVHDAFASPNRVLTQTAQMPDGREYLWIARTVTDQLGTYGTAHRTFAIGLGCDIAHAHRLVYGRGVSDRAPIPIGAGCKVCERTNCTQRAFSQIGRPVHVDLNRSGRMPYPGVPDDGERV